MRAEATKEQKYNQCSRNSAVMLAKMLVFAMMDFEDLGMPGWSVVLEQGINDIMAKYELSPEDLRLSKGERLQ